MSETPSICGNCPNPPETPGVCSGAVMYVKGAVELRDFKGNNTVRAQSIGAGALERVCGVRFIPEEGTLIEEPREDGEPRYAVKVSEKLSSMDDEHKKAVIASMRDDIQQRQDNASKPAPLIPHEPHLTEVKATPGAQLWAELSSFVSDESLLAVAVVSERALDNAQDLIADALRTSQYEREVLELCYAVRHELNDVFQTENLFKQQVSAYLSQHESDGGQGVAPVHARSYTTWTQNRERLPVETADIAHLNAIVMQLARAAETLLDGEFSDLGLIASQRNVYFWEVSKGSTNDTIGLANGYSAHIVLAASRAYNRTLDLLAKLDEVARQLYH